MKLKIGYLYPDLLEVYSDRGNVTILQKRAEWRGIDVQIDRITVGDQVQLQDYDLLFSGGGEDREQVLVADDLLRKRDTLFRAVESGTVILTICGSYQLLGNYFETIGGKRLEGVGLLDVYTVGGEKRLVGNAIGRLTGLDSGQTLVGYENHSGRTYLGAEVTPLADVINGFGNNGEDGREGVVQGNVYGTYLHGPLLSKNPLFADHLLLSALQRKSDSAVLEPLDDSWELAAHNRVLQLHANAGQR